MNSRAHAPSQSLAEWICVSLSLWFIGAFLLVALKSITYPFNLEWMEGQMIDVIQRVVSREPLYVAPSVEYVPFIYTPLYYYVCAIVAQFTGVDFLTGRLVSLLSILGCGTILYRWVSRENGRWTDGLIATGFFFATYHLSGRWFDLARNDSLFLLLNLSALYVLYHSSGKTGGIGAGVLFALAFFTKQSSLIIAFPVILVWLFQNRRKALACAATLLILLTLGIWSLNSVSDGWFDFYAFTVPAGHRLRWGMLYNFWLKDIFLYLLILFGLALYTLICQWKENHAKACLSLGLATGLIGASYAMRLHSYGYLNVLMPAHAALALLGGCALPYLRRLKKPLFQQLAVGLGIVQFLVLIYNPLPLIPSPQSIEQGNAFLHEISLIDGNIFMPELQFVQLRAGKKSYDYGMAALDIYRSNLKNRNQVKVDLYMKLVHMLEQKQFAAIVPGEKISLPPFKDLYVFDHTVSYPQEYVTGGVKPLINLYVRTNATREP